MDAKDTRKSHPRFNDENIQKNSHIAQKIQELAQKRQVTSAQLAIAWVLSKSLKIIPIPGTKRPQYLFENAGAIDIKLSSDDFEHIETLIQTYPNIGDRYNDTFNQFVDKY
jgi:aryl-alcohol dehydrogenase-like predicted oxidoreductase